MTVHRSRHPLFPRRRLAAALAALSMAAAGCGDSSTADQGQQRSAPTPWTASPTKAATKTGRKGAAGGPTLADVGVSPGLAQQLVARANELGYGPATTSFAWVMVDSCKDVKAGATSYAEMVATDIADGAPRADAQQMYDWLRTSFCPHVRAATDQPAPGQGGNAQPPAGLRALGASVKVFDAKFQPVSQAPCRAAQGAPLGTARAYAFGPGVTLCLDYLDQAPLGDVQDSAALVFSPPVPQPAALETVARLLPADATQVNALRGSNADYAPRPGSCLSVLFHSATWQQRMSQYDSTSDVGVTFGTSLNAMLYSDRQTMNGSSSRYDGTVRFASLTSGGHNFGYGTRDITC